MVQISIKKKILYNKFIKFIKYFDISLKFWNLESL